MRRAIALHVVEKNEINENLTCLDKDSNLWETKYWVIGKTTREQLPTGKVFVHRGQKIASHIGGTIQRIYHPDEAEKKRFAIVFLCGRKL
jgi:hypothetical protein